MTLLSGLCAAVAVLLALPPAGRPMQRLGAEPPSASSGSHSIRGPRRLLLGIPLLALLGAIFLAVGARPTVVAATVLIMVDTVSRLMHLHLASRQALEARAQVAHACAVLAGQVRVGRVPSEALRVAAEDCAVLAEADRVHRMGGDVAALWRDRSARAGHRGLLDLARAWQLSQQTGAPLASVLDEVAEALTVEQGVRAVVASELAAPRATGKVMAVLPFCGLALGFLIGGDPVDFLLSGPYGWACLLGGVTLAGVGVLWIDRLARSAGDLE